MLRIENYVISFGMNFELNENFKVRKQLYAEISVLYPSYPSLIYLPVVEWIKPVINCRNCYFVSAKITVTSPKSDTVRHFVMGDRAVM
jgi:hypothetical protein